MRSSACFGPASHKAARGLALPVSSLLHVVQPLYGQFIFAFVMLPCKASASIDSGFEARSS